MAITKLIADSITSGAIANTPFFWSYLGSTQTISATTWTKLNMDTEEIDSDNCYDNVTNYRFTPTSAGIYCFVGRIHPSAAATSIRAMVYKNGAGLFSSKSPISTYNATTSAVIHPNLIGFSEANGTTDYFELFAYANSGININGANATSSSAAGLCFWGAYKIIE